MPIIPSDAARLLNLVAGSGPITFQTFDDDASRRKSKAGRSGLALILHGSLATHAERLMALNARGAGVFAMVNEGDGRGRKAANVTRVRAVFVDLDGAPLEGVLSGPLEPHITVESSPGRFHAYWLVQEFPLEAFVPVQQALAESFGGDKSMAQLNRVLRLPGFLHQKHPEPFRSRILQTADRPRYTLEQLRQAFPVLAAAQAPRAKPTGDRELVGVGERNSYLFARARGFVNKGLTLASVNSRLQRINAERCVPPLCASEVDEIAANAFGKPAAGFTRIPHEVLDSPAWRVLPHPARSIVLAAWRRTNGDPQAHVMLPAEDFAGEYEEKRFYRMRKRAQAAGFLEVVAPSSWDSATQKRTPTIYRLGCPK